MGRAFSDLEEELVPNHLINDMYAHYVNIKKDSLLYSILKKDKILVNSRHKSAIKSTDLVVSAISSDGVIEAVEDSTKKFFVGLEWHPELIMDENSLQIFDYFVNIISE